MARLGKVSQELNTGMDRIVEFLKSNNFQIENNPSAKITDEMYELLLGEFSDGASDKKAATKVDLIHTRETKETVSLPVEEVQTVKEPQKDDFIETSVDEIAKPKVVGKLNLDEKNRPVSKSKPKVVEEPETLVPEDKVEVEELKPAVEEPIVAEVAEESVVEPATEEVVEEQIYSPSTAKTENNVKVVGKIDLSTINQKMRPDKKSPKEREQERKEKMRQQQPKQDVPQKKVDKKQQHEPSKKEAEIYRTEIPVSAGPKIVGQVDLKTSEEDDSRQDKGKRKKRERIKGGRVDIDSREAKEFTKPDKFDRKNNKYGKKGQAYRDEVSEEEVDKSYRDTMSKLEVGKKTKSSKYRRDKREEIRQEIEMAELEQQEQEKILKVTDVVSANDLSAMMNIPAMDIIKACFEIGLMVSLNQRLEADTIQMIAENFGYEVQFVSADAQESIEEVEDKPEDLLPRPPIVTVMGHVDHGKTSLLDYIRKSNVIAGEAGGITQHIGAYNVTLSNGRKITFLDTPGHEAFTAMRARGAQVTDIAIIVVAADDQVMPQTVEAINHAAAAGVPIIFAINKIDKPGANPDKVREQLANMNYLVEEWGGKYQSQEIAAKFGKNVDLLMEKVLLEADMLELKANPNKPAQGTVIESKLDKGRGYTTNVLISSGTLRVGDVILAGMHAGKIKAMFNEREQRIEEAGPSTPVMILGLDGAPQAGDKIHVMESEREAREIASKRERLQREQELRAMKPETLEDIARKIKIGNVQELNLIIKGDVGGSIEALSDSLLKLSTEEIEIVIKHKGVGQISESDVLLASASKAIIVGFQVRPSADARRMAEKLGIDIRLYSIIYDAINEVKDAMSGMLSPEIKEEVIGSCEVRQVFKISKVGTVAGCYVTDGKITRSSKVRVIRDGIVIFTGELSSLRKVKDDVKEMTKGFECGLSINNYNDIQEGDIIEAFEEKEVQRKL